MNFYVQLVTDELAINRRKFNKYYFVGNTNDII